MSRNRPLSASSVTPNPPGAMPLSVVSVGYDRFIAQAIADVCTGEGLDVSLALRDDPYGTSLRVPHLLHVHHHDVVAVEQIMHDLFPELVESESHGQHSSAVHEPAAEHAEHVTLAQPEGGKPGIKAAGVALLISTVGGMIYGLVSILRGLV